MALHNPVRHELPYWLPRWIPVANIVYPTEVCVIPADYSLSIPSYFDVQGTVQLGGTLILE